MLQLLEQLGVVWSWQEDGALELEVQDESKCEAPYHLVRQMRASFCLLGPLWAKRGKASVSMPGGCAIGERPVDLHLKGMQALGGEVLLDNGNIQIQGQVQGGSVYLGGSFGSTVLGTANVLMAAVLGKGRGPRIDLRGAGAGDRGPVPLPAGLRRRHRRRGQPLPDDPRRAVADGLSTSRDRRSHRGPARCSSPA
jgi:hypothetical protein